MSKGKEEIRKLADHYRSGRNELRRDFFDVCFRNCTRYRRASGYFASTALLSWLTGLDRLVKGANDLTIQLIVSHELAPDDAKALRDCHDPLARKRLLETATEAVLDIILALGHNDTLANERVELFAWLVAQGHVDLRLAFPHHVEDAGIFHEKIGVFIFPWGDTVAFTGSANETGSGHRRNYESVDVYRSWVAGDEQRVATKSFQFDEAWKGGAEGLEVVPLSEKALSRIREVAKAPHESKPKPASSGMWKHQDEAVARFMAARRGILEMATGTGKTKTALRILHILFQTSSIRGAIITTDGTDLLNQWSRELDEWVGSLDAPCVIYRHYDEHHELGRFAQAPQGAILVVSRLKLGELFRRLAVANRGKIAVVHDEVHGLGQPTHRASVKGQHASFPYVLGLSATPDRAYDQEGNDFILSEIGPSIFRFGLEAAIARGILCEFDYVPLEYELTENDKQRLAQVYSRQAARSKGGNPMTKEEVWIEISKVYKTAELKPWVFSEYVKTRPETLQRSIAFVETMQCCEPILNIIQEYTNLYRTYDAGDEAENLVRFANGEIDCLITCHRVSQGIDIKSLRTVFLFSSARAKLETVQRIGRCLRTDASQPDKRALVVDFVRPQIGDQDDPNADVERCHWLTAISQTKRGDNIGYQ